MDCATSNVAAVGLIVKLLTGYISKLTRPYFNDSDRCADPGLQHKMVDMPAVLF